MADAIYDLHQLPEGNRIAIMGELAQEGTNVAFFVDTKNADRYIEKLKAAFKVEEVSRHAGPVDGVTTIVIGPRRHLTCSN